MAKFDEYFEGFYRTKTPIDFLAWCESVRKVLRENSDFGKAYRINSTQLIKKFREEALPISRFLRDGPINVDSITLSDDTTNFDATIVISDKTVYYLEVTCAKDGELERWENETINERGGTSTTHGQSAESVRKILRAGGNLPYEVTSDENEIKKIVPMIVGAIEAKQKKEYRSSTYLLVSFSSFHDDPDDVTKIADEVKSSAQINKTKFKDIFLVNGPSRMVLSVY